MGGESRFEIHQNAYMKLVLHALKHRTSAVNAVLIGRSVGGGAAVEIVESVPLFHSQIGLLPPLEIALFMIEEYYSEKGLSIVGYFHANERFDDVELATVAKNIGDHITRYFPQAALLLLDNIKLESLSKQKDRSPVMQLYRKDTSSSWKLAGSDGSSPLSLKEPTANILLLDYISSGKWKDITDFDDHLDDLSE
ncbi:ER membrane protein complex subunit 8/9 homolog isoform X2 [Andrographis paniculata]|nr:ER membrane protein complex subunit 8/9 homolog isoform X2 [Andrographis paniculata]